MNTETIKECLDMSVYAIVKAINCLTRDEERYKKEGKFEACISTRTCLDRLYSTRDEILIVMEEQKRVRND